MLRVLGKRASCKRLSQEKEREEGEGEGFEINSRISRNERNPAHEPYDQFKKKTAEHTAKLYLANPNPPKFR